MQNSLHILIVLLLIAVSFVSCKKDTISPDCFSNVATLRQITNKPALIKYVEGQFYVVEYETIDTKLLPCNLPSEFRIDELKVNISGDVKLSINASTGPCCTENIIITKITR